MVPNDVYSDRTDTAKRIDTRLYELIVLALLNRVDVAQIPPPSLSPTPRKLRIDTFLLTVTAVVENWRV